MADGPCPHGEPHPSACLECLDGAPTRSKPSSWHPAGHSFPAAYEGVCPAVRCGEPDARRVRRVRAMTVRGRYPLPAAEGDRVLWTRRNLSGIVSSGVGTFVLCWLGIEETWDVRLDDGTTAHLYPAFGDTMERVPDHMATGSDSLARSAVLTRAISESASGSDLPNRQRLGRLVARILGHG